MQNAMDKLEQELFGAVSQIETIDCHEHLWDEIQRVAAPADVFTLFSHYTNGDLVAAGMPQADVDNLQNPELPLDYRWAKFAPYWRLIRHTCFSRAALIAAKQFYGVEDIHDGNYAELSDSIAKANRPGLYRKVLKEACHIKVSLIQKIEPEFDKEFFLPVMEQPFFNQFFRGDYTWQPLAWPRFNREAKIQTLDDYLCEGFKFMERAKAMGAVGFKTLARPNNPPDRKAALEAFKSLQNGSVDKLPALNPLTDYLHDEFIREVGRLDMVLAVHTGYWGDFRELDPLHLLPLIQRHPDVRFDIYHLGYPWGRETLMLAKSFPNVWLNLCWTHIISQRFAESMMTEALELVPLNKISAFGGDYGKPVEKVYGHLMMAREDLAKTLAGGVRSGRFTVGAAVDIASLWLFENPKELYKLSF